MPPVPSSRAADRPVTVVGAGPAGLALSVALASAGVECTVLESRAETSRESRALALYPRSLELLDLAGGAREFVRAGLRVDRLHLSASKSVDIARTDSRFPFLDVIPQSRTEELLQERALDLGVRVLRGHEVRGLAQDEHGVTLQVRGPDGEYAHRSEWVAGCDGANSSVRMLTGIGFPGSTYDFAIVLADVRLRSEPRADLLLRPCRDGIVVTVAYGDGYYRVAVANRHQRYGRDPLELPEFAELLERTLGFDAGPHDARWLSRFQVHRRLATRYRAGRVLLAGDAAHVHSPLGGQGLNTGVQDGIGLGWRLAAQVRGWAPPWLLDSYERERRPVAAQVIRTSDLATRTTVAMSGPHRALRVAALEGLLALPAVQRFAGEAAAELRVRQPPGGVPRRRSVLRPGDRMPDTSVASTAGLPAGRLYEVLGDGRYVLLDFAGARPSGASGDGDGYGDGGMAAGGPVTPDTAATERAAAPWADRVHVVPALLRPKGLRRAALALVRPDGYLAWTGRRPADPELPGVLRHWCGEPGPAGHTEADAGLYVAVQSFYARQMRLLDEGDPDGFARTFTEDGVLSLAGTEVELHGREAIAKGQRAEAEQAGAGRPRHWFGMLTARTGPGGEIHTRYLATIGVTRPGDPHELQPAASVDDVLVRAPGGLLTRSRTVTRDDVPQAAGTAREADAS
ncbi:FAD-dependent monooxygenase [Streptomyces sp. NPDC048182]|uniref:FAD-dependent monooxygenase n=1 Tax=Streptomyces sp. NPDC048182 TaxID=3365507 RepID=UPI0037187796